MLRQCFTCLSAQMVLMFSGLAALCTTPSSHYITFLLLNLLLMKCDTVSPGRAQPQRVVLPEALDPRVLTASAELAARGLARVVLLGQPERVAAQARKLGVDIAKARGLPVVHGREAMLLRMISIGMHGCRAQ